VVEWHLKVIFCLMTSKKFDFGEVEKAMFQVVARHWEIIFFALTSPKCDLCEFEKVISSARVALSTYFRPLDLPEMRIG